jgi:integrase
MFNRAIDWGWENANPAHGIKKFKERSRDRFIQSDELPRFFAALGEETSIIVRDYILISLLTGARRSNVLSMRWDEINFDRITWTIPLTKNGESHTLPLVPAAIDVLKTRQKNNINSSPWVFPGTGASGHLVETKKPWKRILNKAGIKDLRIHDLRRSLGSWQAATGASLSIIGKTLAHKNISTTAIYARLNIDPVRESMNKATNAILSAAGVK